MSYKQSSEYYLEDENSMADLNAKVADLSSKGSAIAGSIGLLVENNYATFRLTNSKGSWNPKFYKKGWRGNQWIRTTKISNIGKYWRYGGDIFGVFGIVASGYQFYSAETLDKKVEYGFDMLIGPLGFIKGVGTGVSLYWSFGGKELHYMYVERVLIPQVQMGLNPGLPVYQPFK